MIKKPPRKTVDCTCDWCGAALKKNAGHVNRSKKLGAPIYCNKTCAGLGRRKPDKLTGDAAKAAKREYDRRYREINAETRKAQKAAWYAANRTEIEAKHKVYRKAHMARHVAYCQQPEYKAWKVEYDRCHRAKKQFGEFAESFLLLQDVEKEVLSQATRYEIQLSNGTLNKAQQRKRSL